MIVYVVKRSVMWLLCTDHSAWWKKKSKEAARPPLIPISYHCSPVGGRWKKKSREAVSPVGGCTSALWLCVRTIELGGKRGGKRKAVRQQRPLIPIRSHCGPVLGTLSALCLCAWTTGLGGGKGKARR